MRSLLLLVVAAFLEASWASAPVAAHWRAQADTVVVRGIVFDSLAARPLADANVQLVGADSALSAQRFTARSDSTGAFLVRGVPSGRYIVGFFHPALDTLGFEVRDRLVDIGTANSFVGLGTPSAETLIGALCQSTDAAPSGAAARAGLLVGHVHDVHTESAVENGTVTVVWSEAQSTPSGLRVMDRQGTAKTRAAGWFALCGVPRDIPLTVRAGRDADSSGAVVTRVPAEGFSHLTLSVGSPKDHRGRILGHVVAEGRRPVPSARIARAGSDEETVTTDSGDFAMNGVSLGTQTLTVRAIGYAPRTINVQVGEDGATRTEITLERMVALPTMTARDSVPTAHLAEFLHDKKTDATGAYFVQPIRLPGYEAQQTVCSLIAGVVSVPACTSGSNARGTCEGFLLNGKVTSLDLNDLDPSDILGVEVLKAAGVSRYAEEIRAHRQQNPCQVVVWTKCPGFVVPRCDPAVNRSTPKKEPDEPVDWSTPE